MPEMWRPVRGFYQFYEVSDDGRVRSVARYAEYRYCGDARVRLKAGQVLSPKTRTAYGHLEVNLSVGGNSSMRQVHRLVLDAFVGPCPDGLEACHLDGDAGNNRVSNLRWDTSKANTDDMRRHGTLAVGAKMPHSKLSEPLVREILSSVEPGTVLAKRYGVKPSTIWMVRHRKTWKHVRVD